MVPPTVLLMKKLQTQITHFTFHHTLRDTQQEHVHQQTASVTHTFTEVMLPTTLSLW